MHMSARSQMDVAYYVVEIGDTLSAIAEAFGISLANVLHANQDIANPDHIEVGQVIAIPGRHRIFPPNRVRTSYSPAKQ